MPSARSARNTFSFAPGSQPVTAADHLHVARPRPGALDLEVALVVAAPVRVVVVTRDRDQVLGVRAVALELVALGGGLLGLVLVARAVAVVVGHRAARLLLVGAGKDQDPGAVLRGVHRSLDVAVLASRQQREALAARRLRLLRARGDLADQLSRVRLADHERRTGLLVLRHLARPCGSGSTTSARRDRGPTRGRGSPARGVPAERSANARRQHTRSRGQSPMAAWAAATRAIGTRYGEQLT